MSISSLLTFSDTAETTALAAALQAAVDKFHAERGIAETDVKLVNYACTVVMISHLSKLDSWTSYILVNAVIQGLLVGIKTEQQFLQEEALRGSRSS